MSNIQLHAGFFNNPTTVQKFTNVLGENRSRQYVASILTVVADSNLLQKATPDSVYQSALIAATLDLSILPSLGEAWIVPYSGKAQFQLGYKGLIQLALRTGRYHKINTIPVYENQFKSFNALTEVFDADFSVTGAGAIVGYIAWFRLHDGFEKTEFWTVEKVKNHARKYGTFEKTSQYGLIKSPWNDPAQFDAMALKTVLKHALLNYGPKSMELQRAIEADQSVVVDAENNKFEYVDNQPDAIDISAEILGNDADGDRVL